MSLQSLIGFDSVTVLRPAGDRDNLGGAVYEPYSEIGTIPARVQPTSAAQQSTYGALNVTATHVVFTQSETPENGDVLLTSDGLRLRIEGWNIHRGIGGIPTYYEYLCEEVRN